MMASRRMEIRSGIAAAEEEVVIVVRKVESGVMR